MFEEHFLLPDITNILDQRLQTVSRNHGIQPSSDSNRFGLVGFGSFDSQLAKGVTIRMDDQALFGTASQFSQATLYLGTYGSMEDGYHAAMLALRQYPFRSGAACHLLLATDEGRTQLAPPIEFNTMKEAILASNCTLHVLVNEEFEGNALGASYSGDAYFERPNGTYHLMAGAGRAFPISGDGNTHRAYVELAFATHGSAWNINRLRGEDAAVQSFSRALSGFATRSTYATLCDSCTCQYDGELLCRPCEA